MFRGEEEEEGEDRNKIDFAWGFYRDEGEKNNGIEILSRSPPPLFFLLNKFIEDEHKIFFLEKYNLNAHGLMLYKVKQALVDAS